MNKITEDILQVNVSYPLVIGRLKLTQILPNGRWYYLEQYRKSENNFVISITNSLHFSQIVRNIALQRRWRDFGQQFDRKNEWISSISVTRVLLSSFRVSILTLPGIGPTPSCFAPVLSQRRITATALP